MPITLFIADLHLAASEPAITQLFLDFLATKAPQAEALYILGDLFRLWIGDDDTSPFNTQISTALHQTPIPVFLLPGNRDFLLGQRFAQASGCTLLPDPTIIDVYGKRTLLTHGDKLCTQDISHVYFQKYLLHKNVIKLFLQLPLRLRRLLAEQVHWHSKWHKKIKSATTMDVAPHAIADIIRATNVDQIIHGHIHQAQTFYHSIANKQVTRHVLGSWTTQQWDYLQLQA